MMMIYSYIFRLWLKATGYDQCKSILKDAPAHFDGYLWFLRPFYPLIWISKHPSGCFYKANSQYALASGEANGRMVFILTAQILRGALKHPARQKTCKRTKGARVGRGSACAPTITPMLGVLAPLVGFQNANSQNALASGEANGRIRLGHNP